MWEANRSALTIASGEELERFDLGDVVINGQRYTVLTGFEGSGKCWWCGGQLTGRSRQYCRGHMQPYYNHFMWQNASFQAMKRADKKCENCGASHETLKAGYSGYMRNLQVHHIVPLKGSARFFSAYNLPWNLVVLCLDCHHEIHRIMNGMSFELRRRLNEEQARKLQPVLF